LVAGTSNQGCFYKIFNQPDLETAFSASYIHCLNPRNLLWKVHLMMKVILPQRSSASLLFVPSFFFPATSNEVMHRL